MQIRIDPKQVNLVSSDLLSLSRRIRTAREEVEQIRRRLRQHSQLDECHMALRKHGEELEQLTAHLVQLSSTLGQVARLSQRTELRNTDRLEEDGRPCRTRIPVSVRVVDGVYQAKIQQILRHS